MRVPRLGRWAAPASLTLAAFVLSACAGGNITPNAQGLTQARTGGALNAERPQIANSKLFPSASCPTSLYLDCVTISKKTGAKLVWCYGPSSNPCGDSDAGKAKWSGLACLAKTKACKKPFKPIKTKWTGPFTCKTQDKCTGTYELDTLTPGPGLKVTQDYLYKQHIEICPKGGSCESTYIGINVEK
jgi:hypothetical protein